MKAYTLKITRDGKTQTLTVQPGQQAAVQAEPDTAYQLLDAEGNLIAQPDVEWVGDDLWVYAEEAGTGRPELVLKDYRTSYPVHNQAYTAQTGNTFVTAADEAAAAQIVSPVAEEVGIGALKSGPKLWGALAAAAGLAAAGLAGLRGGKGTGSRQPDAEPALELNGANDSKGLSETPKTDGKPSQPEVQAEPEKPQSVRGTEKPQPAAEPEKTAEPAEEGKPAKPSVGPEKPPVPPTQPDRPAEPAKPVQPAKPAKVLPKPVISFDALAGDDIVNAAESQVPLSVSGKVENARNGDVVTLAAGGQTYQAVVRNGAFSIDIAGKVLASANEIRAHIQTADDEGNRAEASVAKSYAADTDIAVPVIRFDAVAQDDIINLAESQAPTITVSGTVAHAAENDEIVLEVGSAVYRGTLTGGTFAVAVDTKTLLNHGKIAASLSTADKAQNTATGMAEHVYRVDTEYRPAISLNPIAGDNVLNIAESQGKVTVGGKVDDVADGTDVLVSCGCESCATVQWIEIWTKVKNGSFSVDFAGADMKGADYNTVKARVIASDDAGNTATVETSQSYTQDLQAPQVAVAIDALAVDDVFDKAERARPSHVVSGKVSGMQAGEQISSVTLIVNGRDYDAQFNGDTFRADIPTDQLTAVNRITARATVADQAGNLTTAEHSRSYQTKIPEPVITLNPVTGDHTINKAEADGNAITLSGRVDNVADGTRVSLNVGAQSTEAEVLNGLFSVGVDKNFFGINSNTRTATGTLTASVSAPGDDGTDVTVSANQSYTIDLVNTTAVTIDAVTGDNVVDAEELAKPVMVVSGKVTDGKTGETVTVTVNKVAYTTTVQADGTYRVEAETARVFPNGNEGKYSVSASVKRIDEAGNEGSGNAALSRIFTVDKTAPSGVVVLDALTGDKVLNRNEAAQTTVKVSGSVSRLSDGDDVQSVTVTVGGNDYAAVLMGTSFSAEVPADVMAANTEIRARGVVKDSAGRTAEAAGTSQNYTLQTAPPAVEVRIDSINEGKAVHAEGLSEKVRITGSVLAGATVSAGSETVSVTVNGKTYSPELNGSSWVLELPAALLAAGEGRQSLTAHVRAADAYGNTAEHTATGSYLVDTVAPVPLIALNDITAGNVIGERDKGGDIAVSGKVSGEFKASDTVVLTINGTQQQAALLPDGAFTANVSGALLAAAAVPVIHAAVATQDDAGNRGSAQTSLTYSVRSGDIQIRLDTITGDDLINVTEAGQPVEITGSVSGADARPGQTVRLTVGAETFQAEVKDDYRFNLKIDAEKLLANQGYTIQTGISGLNGAEALAARSYEVAPEAAAKIDITAIGNGFNVGVQQVVPTTRIGGIIELDGAFAEGMNSERLRQITVSAGGKTYTAGVKADRSFFLDIPTQDLVALNGEKLGIKVEADPQLYDLVQTGANAYRINNLPLYADVEVKSIRFDSPYIERNAAGDYVVSRSDASTVGISGTAAGSAKAGDTVTLEVGGKVYTAKLADNLTFAAEVAAGDLAADTDRAVRAVLRTADLSGKSITVADTETYALQNRNDGRFVSAHARANGASVKSDHTEADYNFPYFIQKAGNLNGGSYRIPFGGKTDGVAVVKYHFMTLEEIKGLSENYNNYIDRSTMTTYSSELQDIVRNAYKAISAVTNIEFVETGNMADAQTNYFMGNLTNGFEGSSAIAYNGGLVAWNSRHNYMAWGKDFVHYTVLHEVTHTLGMAHTSNGFTGDYLKEENIEFSNMSYNAYTNNSLFLSKGALRTYDLAYLHYAFGINQNVRTGDDTYTFKNYNMYSQDADRYIWDAGGVDTFNASAEQQGVNVNLMPGSWIYTGSNLEKTFAVKSNATYDMRSYFGLDANAALSGNSNAKVGLNTYTEGQAFIGYGTQIENLIGSGHNDVLTGNRADNNIEGGAGNDILTGGEGNDYLDGGQGGDMLTGGSGNDSYVTDDAGDTVTEAAGEGEDHVYSSVDYVLGGHLEHLTLIGATAVNGSGNALDNTLTGNGADNVLNGGAGDDRIIGGAGSDTLTGAEGRDTFVFDRTLDGSVDTVTDFEAGTDLIELDNSVFESLTANTMAQWQQYVRYQADTGRLLYDSDGSGKGDGIHFATLDSGLAIDQNSFNVV